MSECEVGREEGVLIKMCITCTGNAYQITWDVR